MRRVAAGTGKSVVECVFAASMERMQFTVMVMATTNKATISNGGCTVHRSIGRRSLDYYSPMHARDERADAFVNGNSLEKRAIVSACYGIEDEVSMASPDLTQYQSEIYKRCRGNSRPFGGIIMLFAGDAKQCSVVCVYTRPWIFTNFFDNPRTPQQVFDMCKDCIKSNPNHTLRMKLERVVKDVETCIGSTVEKSIFIDMPKFFLTKNYRQLGCEKLTSVVTNLGTDGHLSAESLQILRNRVVLKNCMVEDIHPGTTRAVAYKRTAVNSVNGMFAKGGKSVSYSACMDFEENAYSRDTESEYFTRTEASTDAHAMAAFDTLMELAKSATEYVFEKVLAELVSDDDIDPAYKRSVESRKKSYVICEGQTVLFDQEWWIENEYTQTCMAKKNSSGIVRAVSPDMVSVELPDGNLIDISPKCV